jgi:carboxyl-terminal processing protease
MISRTVSAALVLLMTAACTIQTPPRTRPGQAAGESAACASPQGTAPAETATTIDVIEQAYQCILDRYYRGPRLDSRVLLSAAFRAFTQELNRAGRDSAQATMPALTGDRKADWAAFETVYRRVTDQLPAQGDLRANLAAATLQAIVDSLEDDHARWAGSIPPPPGRYDGDLYGLGFRPNIPGAALHDPDAAVSPLFVTEVLGGAAQAARLRPGDVIESINGSAPFIDGHLVAGALTALYAGYPEAKPVLLGLRRPDTGRRWSVRLKPGLFQPDPIAMRTVTSKPLGDGIAYVRLTGFASDVANRIFTAIGRLATGTKLTGLVLDLRGNGGGRPDEANRLLGGFVHDKITAYQCDVDGECQIMRTDDTVALLNLPLVVLTDRGCASACEHFSSAVKDLRLGQVVGTRTAGVVSGPAQPYALSNNTLLSFPTQHHLAPNHEVIDRIGVAPDYYVPLTPKDAAAGRDPALAKALSLLRK